MITLKSSDSADNDWSRDIKGNMYDIVVEGFQLLGRWTGRIWEQCAWKFSRPCKEPPISDSQQNTTTFFDYEKVFLSSLQAVLTFLLRLMIWLFLYSSFQNDCCHLVQFTARSFPCIAACLSEGCIRGKLL